MDFTIENYISEHAKTFQAMDTQMIQRSIGMVFDTIAEDKKIITCGNGGSSSTASHYITDWNKMYNLASGEKFRGLCLADNLGLITAFGNDLSYDEVFSGQLNSVMDAGDLLVVVSGSGNSANILNAINTAKNLGGKTLGVLGYDGGKAMPLCDEVFHVPSWDMQICEDLHLSFGHIVMKAICRSKIQTTL